MKAAASFLGLGVLVLSASFAHAGSTLEVSTKACAFGQSTSDWENSSLRARLGLNVGKRSSLRPGTRLQHLSPEQIYLIHKTMVLENDAFGPNAMSPDQAVEEFLKQDGFVQPLELRGDRFLYVGSYPGDNESGVIFKLAKTRTRPNGVVVASVGDQEIDECKVLR